MGNSSGYESRNSDEEEGIVEVIKGRYDYTKIYWDIDGNLRYGQTDKNRDEEVLELLQLDNPDETDPEKLWMIIPSRWVRKWLLFAHLKSGEPEPGKIDMDTLLVRDENFKPENWDGSCMPFGWRPKNTLKPPAPGLMENDSFPGHYRRVGIEVWKKLVKIYKVQGYPIAVRGAPFDDMSRWRIFKSTEDVKIDKLPAPKLEEKKDDKDTEEKKGLISSVTGGMSQMMGSLGLGGGSKTKTPVKNEETKK